MSAMETGFFQVWGRGKIHSEKPTWHFWFFSEI
jgi:hypothetical protein